MAVFGCDEDQCVRRFGIGTGTVIRFDIALVAVVDIDSAGTLRTPPRLNLKGIGCIDRNCVPVIVLVIAWQAD